MNLLERSAAALRLCVRKGVRMRAQATKCKTPGSPFPGADKRKDQLSAGVGGAAPMFLAAMIWSASGSGAAAMLVREEATDRRWFHQNHREE